jgi:Spy/CpxP family protein refolding chaperone
VTTNITYASLSDAEEVILFSTRLFAAATLAAGLAIPAAAFAQTPGAPVPPPAGAPAAHHHHHRSALRAALGKLNLSSAQHAQLAAVFAQAKQQRQANRTADPATRKANARQFRSQIDGILTQAQRAQFHTALQQVRAQRHHHRALTAPAPGTAPH